MAFLEIDTLTLRLGEPHREVLSGITFNAEASTLTLILGSNGSGKSVLLRAILGLLRASGRVRVEGQILGRNRRSLYRYTGVAFQNPDLQIFGDTVAEDLRLALHRTEGGAASWNGLAEGSDAAIDELDRLLDAFGLAACANDSPWDLSGGQRRRLALAAACAGRPSLLLLDEPYIELDYPAILALNAELQRLKHHGTTIIVASHETRDVWPLTDQVVLLHAGRCLFAGAPTASRALITPDHGLRPAEPLE